MAALASGHDSGIVLDIGHAESRAVAFADGYIVLQSLAGMECLDMGIILNRRLPFTHTVPISYHY
jgi:hypothetical protein